MTTTPHDTACCCETCISSEKVRIVPHAKLRCTCAACIAERQAEMRRRLEEARREDARGRELACLEAMGGVVYARMGSPKPQPGTLQAIAKRYGGSR